MALEGRGINNYVLNIIIVLMFVFLFMFISSIKENHKNVT